MNTRCFALLLLLTLLAQSAPAQQPPAPQKEHDWLKQFTGEWESASEGKPVPDQPAVKCTGTMKGRMMGDIWLIIDNQMEAMGQKVTAQMTLGYDPTGKKYMGTWIDSMTNHMWQYSGSVDATGKILTLEAEGPNFMGDGKLAKFRDVYEFKSADQIAVSSSMQGADGKWTTLMTGIATRKK